MAQQFTREVTYLEEKIQIWSRMKARSLSQKFSSKPQNERLCKAQKGQSIMRLFGKRGTICVKPRDLELMP